MDRRSFLRAVAGIGLASLLPASASGDLTDVAVDEAWQALEEAPVEFVAENGCTLVVANYPNPKTRLDLFDLSESCIASPRDLAWELDSCPPLAWHVGRLSEEMKEEALYALQEKLDEQELPKADACKQMAAEERNWPDADDPDALADWVGRIDETSFADVAASVRAWLNDEPDWRWEADYFSDYAHGQSAALAFFQQQPPELLDALGIEIVEGECPGSTYYAAEIGIGIEEANRVAKEMAMPVRFSRG